jgi:hypothetical protein
VYTPPVASQKNEQDTDRGYSQPTDIQPETPAVPAETYGASRSSYAQRSDLPAETTAPGATLPASSQEAPPVPSEPTDSTNTDALKARSFSTSISQGSAARRQERSQEAIPPPAPKKEPTEYEKMLFGEAVVDEITEEMKESALSGAALRQVVEKDRKEGSSKIVAPAEHATNVVRLRPVIDRTGEPSAGPSQSAAPAPTTIPEPVPLPSDTSLFEQEDGGMPMPPPQNGPGGGAQPYAG